MHSVASAVTKKMPLTVNGSIGIGAKTQSALQVYAQGFNKGFYKYGWDIPGFYCQLLTPSSLYKVWLLIGCHSFSVVTTNETPLLTKLNHRAE